MWLLMFFTVFLLYYIAALLCKIKYITFLAVH